MPYVSSDADGGSGEMKCTAKNKTEARQRGREYIKAWKLRGAKNRIHQGNGCSGGAGV